MDDQFDNRELIIEYLESGCKGCLLYTSDAADE